jgi:hypothetical protein
MLTTLAYTLREAWRSPKWGGHVWAKHSSLLRQCVNDVIQKSFITPGPGRSTLRF